MYELHCDSVSVLYKKKFPHFCATYSGLEIFDNMCFSYRDSVERRSSFESSANTLDQNVVIEWLSQEPNGAGFQGLHSHSRISIRRDEDDRYPAILLRQLGLEVEATHPGHTDIGDQASGLPLLAGYQKLLR